MFSNGWSVGREAMQRTANPCTSVRIRYRPPIKILSLRKDLSLWQSRKYNAVILNKVKNLIKEIKIGALAQLVRAQDVEHSETRQANL